MAVREPLWRQPWSLAALVILVAALPVMLFGPLALGLVMAVAGQAVNIIGIRRANRGAGERSTPKRPPQ